MTTRVCDASGTVCITLTTAANAKQGPPRFRPFERARGFQVWSMPAGEDDNHTVRDAKLILLQRMPNADVASRVYSSVVAGNANGDHPDCVDYNGEHAMSCLMPDGIAGGCIEEAGVKKCKPPPTTT